jgi:hypothetical protein
MLSAFAATAFFIACAGGLGQFPCLAERYKRPQRLEELAVSVTVGVGMAIILFYYGSKLAGLAVGWPILLAGLAGWGLFWRRGANALQLRGERLPLVFSAIALLTVAMALRVYFQSELPHGGDPTFHCLIVNLILEQQQSPTSWEPYHAVPLNYPSGMHVMIAGISQLSNTAPHQVFMALMVVLASLQYWLWYVLFRRLCGSRAPALISLLVGTVAVVQGSTYATVFWGGLPTLFCLNLFLAYVILCQRPGTRLRVIWGGICLAGLALTHHLSSLIACVILAGFLACELLMDRWRGKARFLLATVGVQLLLISPYLYSFLAHMGDLGHSDTLTFLEEPIFGWRYIIGERGPGVLLFVVAVLILGAHGQGLWRGKRLALCWLIGTGLVYIAVGQIYPRCGEIGDYARTALTPSRWLTMGSLGLGVLAAAPLGRLWQAGRQKWRVLIICVTVLAILDGGIRHLRVAQKAPQLTTDWYTWVADNTDEGDVVILPGATMRSGWTAYFTGCETFHVILPASEPRHHPWLSERYRVLSTLEPQATRAWLKKRGKRGVIVMKAANCPPGAAIRDTYDGWVAVDIPTGED